MLTISGWVVGRDGPARSVEVSSGGRVVWELPVHDRRPDVAALHPETDWALHAGFSGAVATLRLPREWTLELVAREGDGQALPLARIEGSRAPLDPAAHELEPLMVTTLGRTGSSWFVHLLGTHPDVVAYRPFSFEPRALTYWMDLLMSLAEPASYTQQVDGEVFYPQPWWLGSGPRMTPALLPDPGLSRWLGSENIDELARFAQGRIDAVYKQVAAAAGKEPTHFAEKCLPGNNSQELLSELYPDAREIFLVRDFRDMLCSILAFNRKRGRAAFGTDESVGGDAYVHNLGQSVAGLLAEWRSRKARAHLVRYEDLVLDPQGTLGGALAHVRLDDSTDVVAGMVDQASAEIPGMGEHRTAVSARDSIGRWKDDLPEGLAAACEDAFGTALEEFGYHA